MWSAHAGALAGGLDDEGQGEGRHHDAVGTVQDFRLRRGNPRIQKYFLGFGFVKAQGAGTGAGPCIRNAAFFQNGLEGSVLAERAVDNVVGQLRAFRQPEIRAVHVHLRYIGESGPAQGIVNGVAGNKGYFPFRSGTSEQEGDFEVALESVHMEIDSEWVKTGGPGLR